MLGQARAMGLGIAWDYHIRGKKSKRGAWKPSRWGGTQMDRHDGRGSRNVLDQALRTASRGPAPTSDAMRSWVSIENHGGVSILAAGQRFDEQDGSRQRRDSKKWEYKPLLLPPTLKASTKRLSPSPAPFYRSPQGLDSWLRAGMDPTCDLEKGSAPPRPTSSLSQSVNREAYHSDSVSSTEAPSVSSSQDAFDCLFQVQTVQSHHGAGLERHPTALERIATQRSQHNATVGAGRKQKWEEAGPLPDFGAGKPYPAPLPDKEEYVVEFAGRDDPLHPQNWPTSKKLLTATILSFTTLNSTFTSSIYSAAISAVGTEYNVSNEVSTLGLSLYVLGFATGPVLWAPFSELKGRRLPLLLSIFGFTIFQFAVATAQNIQTIMLCRFFGGFFGACPIAVVAAVLADIYDNRVRGLAITVFAMAVFTGPLIASTVSGFIVQNLGWRWTEYITGIMGASALLIDLVLLQETYPPIILVQKAAELRRRTQNWGIHAKQEEIEVDYRQLIRKNLLRPVKILFLEPIVLLLSIYMAFLYGLLYLFLTAYPIVFQRIHGFHPGVGGLPYWGLVIGECLGGVYIILTQPSYNRKLVANNDIPVPEWRMPPAIVGSVAFAGGLFWFGWSGWKAEIHWAVPMTSGLLIGFGLFCIFLQSLNYILDAYTSFAASALAANSILRSSAGAGFPLFATYMFNSLGVNWASTLLGCVAVLLVPLPIIFYAYGPKIRAKSTFATDHALAAGIEDEREK
ncbi:Major facilitator superfamily multidrug transporter FLU1 [Penicillium canariense]|uniref:Major facilitator superfamily multidrug transporter FLU1 n=1 Tax=Penicillium canariense TaxID=189055 RepID=A0A9W9IHB7_9EURO|nr:Major facilitator superfamily multidrug transporter FLU1 [Penicillium canariense]KAJ5176422.1 Major facilitator superfamily multidrug transporter FLU1 [Penicillium canariense]